jgi:hypothetical protein
MFVYIHTSYTNTNNQFIDIYMWRPHKAPKRLVYLGVGTEASFVFIYFLFYLFIYLFIIYTYIYTYIYMAHTPGIVHVHIY